MKILVSGGAGFIGSHLCKDLLEKNNKVICVDNLISGNYKNIEEFESNPNFVFINHDISRPLNLKEKIDEVCDLACPASPADFSRLPIEILEVNSQGVKNMLNLALKNKARFFHTSTSEVYGDPLVHPQPESYWGNSNSYGPRACYDEGKRFAEALIYNYKKKYHLKTQIIRIFNTYGPKMRPNDGRCLSNFVVQALKGQDLTIYGEGSQTRSFCYIDDQIAGINAMRISNEEGPINIGNPGEFTILELANKVLKITRSKSKIIFKPLPKDDPKQRKPDIRLAKEKINWRPKVNLEKGLEMTINWFRNEIKRSK